MGGSNLALASINWVIEQIKDADGLDEEGAFWINGTVKDNGNSAEKFDVLAFKNKIINYTVKFDVICEGYAWEAEEAATHLGLEWNMRPLTDDGEEPDEPDEPVIDEEKNQICYNGNGGDDSNPICFNITDTAQKISRDTGEVIEDDPVVVELRIEEGNIVVLYENFGETDLFHDPQFGYTEGYNGDNGEECFFLDIFCIIGQIIAWFLSIFGL